jgi:ubiquitin-like protein ATG12
MLTMAASVVLGNLPRDATAALEAAAAAAAAVGGEKGKVQIRIQPISSAPHLTQRVFKISPTSPFSSIHRFLRRKLGLKPHEALHCYVGNVFAPGLEEEVGGLWRCFKSGEELVVGYAVVEAFG